MLRNIKIESPYVKYTDKFGKKKHEKPFKVKRVYVAWDENDVFSSNEYLKNNEDINLCLMVDCENASTISSLFMKQITMICYMHLNNCMTRLISWLVLTL